MSNHCKGLTTSGCETSKSVLENNEDVFYGKPNPEHLPNHPCDPHQARILRIVKEEAIALMDKIGKPIMPITAKDFEELHQQVKKLIDIPGVGPLTIYDVALRLGRHYGIEPKDYVYLHAKPLVNAKELEKKGYINLPVKKMPCVPIGVFTTTFPGISAANIEHYLCVCTKDFNDLPNVSAPCSIIGKLHV